MIPDGYHVEKTNERVQNVEPELITRFKWRADKRCKKMNKLLAVPFYRYEVCPWFKARWAVQAMQNRLVPNE
jgi:hypothetical protein